MEAENQPLRHPNFISYGLHWQLISCLRLVHTVSTIVFCFSHIAFSHSHWNSETSYFLLSWQQGAKWQSHVSEPKVSRKFYFTLKHEPCPQTSTGKHDQAFSAQSRPSGPLFLLLVFTFPSAIRHKLFMAKLLLTMFMQCLVQWHPFSAGASGHLCNTDNMMIATIITASYAFSTGHTLPVSCPTELRSLYFTTGSWSVPGAILQ